MGKVGAQAELTLAAEPATQVGGDVALTLLVARHRHRAYVFRALGDVVDQAAWFGDATLQAGQALEQFHLLLVFQRNALLARDGLPVDLVAAGGIELEAAHVEVLVVADRRVAFAHRGVALQEFAECSHLAIDDQLLAEHGNRRGRLQQGGWRKTCHRRVINLIAVAVHLGHLHGGQCDAVLRQTVRGGQGQAQTEQAQGQVRAGQGHAEGSLMACSRRTVMPRCGPG
ncbi:hypothetical protein D3C77_113140 [compost metagenome]